MANLGPPTLFLANLRKAWQVDQWGFWSTAMPTDSRLHRSEGGTATRGNTVQFTAGSRLSNAGLETLFGNSNKVSPREMNVHRCLQAYGGKTTHQSPVRAHSKAKATVTSKATRDIKFDVLRKLHEKSNAGTVSLREVHMAFDECVKADGPQTAC